jgi:hypothetical protein
MERAEKKERLTSNDKVSTFLGSIPATFDRVESETRQRNTVELKTVHNKISRPETTVSLKKKCFRSERVF